MPIPFLLGAIGVGVAVLGAGGHLSAKETNEKAQQISEDAQSLYNSAKCSLEASQGVTEKSLLALGYSKKKVLETSINQFLISYERIKHIEICDSIGIDEAQNFTLDKQDILQLREMSSIYQSTFSSGAAGVATGAVIALAASGSLPIVTGVLSTAGTALMVGEFGMAAGLAGSALSFGAAMTPLAAIAAPALLFSGISSSIKADENLEKARTMYAEAEVASEQMKTSEVLCVAIADRADMFDKLLGDLNELFAQCTALLDNVTRKRLSIFKNEFIDAGELTLEEKRLIAVTGSLAKAVKAVIDTPILTSEGIISSDADEIYKNTKQALPKFVEQVNEVKAFTYNIKPDIKLIETKTTKQKTENASNLPSKVRNIFAVILGCFMYRFMQGMIFESTIVGLLSFAITTLLVMENATESKIFKPVKNLCCIAIAGCFSVIFYNNCLDIVYMSHYIIRSIIVGFISFFIFGICIPDKNRKSNNLKRTLARIFGCIFFFTLALLVFAILYKFIGISSEISVVITVVLYAFFAFAASFMDD